MPKTNGSFRKGDGRKRKPKGALNRTTKEAHELFIMIMNRQMDRVEIALKNIRDDEKYLNSLSKLLQYYIPRKTDITSDGDKIAPQMPTVIIKTKKNGSN
jgi:hypothetical protein